MLAYYAYLAHPLLLVLLILLVVGLLPGLPYVRGRWDYSPIILLTFIAVLFLLFGCSAGASVEAFATPTPQPTPVVLDTSSLFSFGQGASDAHAFTLMAYPTYAPKLNNGAWGGGIAGFYPISQYAFTGLRLDFLDGNYYAASAAVGAKADIQIFGHTVTPFALTGVISPISGAGDKNQSVGAIVGAGFYGTIWQSKDKRTKLSAFGEAEYWSQYPGVQIFHAGAMASFTW